MFYIVWINRERKRLSPEQQADWCMWRQCKHGGGSSLILSQHMVVEEVGLVLGNDVHLESLLRRLVLVDQPVHASHTTTLDDE